MADTTAPRGKWRYCPEPRPDAALTLFCFHHSGGGAFAFRSWGALFPPRIEVVAIQTPGRENRRGETPIASAEELLDALVPKLTAWLDRPYALFGHSVGAMVAYHVACRLAAVGAPKPRRLFLAAARPPLAVTQQGPAVEPLLSDADILDLLGRLGGTPAVVLQNPALAAVFLPALKADFSLNRSLRRLPGLRLNTSISAFAGAADPIAAPADLMGWSAFTSSAYDLQAFPGGHFFVQSELVPVIAAIADRLEDAVG